MSLVRDEEIPACVYHLVCHVLVRHVDGTYLLMQRDPTKSVYPNYWEATAGGSVLKGETVLEGAFRELREETGIVAQTLEELNRDVGKSQLNVRFLCITDCDKRSVKLQPGETCAFKWATATEILAMTESELISWPMRKFIK